MVPLWRSGGSRVQCPCVSPQLSHDGNETLPLHLYVKSDDGRNVDSKLQGGWGGQRSRRARGGRAGRGCPADLRRPCPQ